MKAVWSEEGRTSILVGSAAELLSNATELLPDYNQGVQAKVGLTIAQAQAYATLAVVSELVVIREALEDRRYWGDPA